MRLSVSFWFADMQENITKNQNETFLDIIINKPYKELSIIISKKVSFWFFLVFSWVLQYIRKSKSDWKSHFAFLQCFTYQISKMSYLFSYFGFDFLYDFNWFLNVLLKIQDAVDFMSHFGKMLNAAKNKMKSKIPKTRCRKKSQQHPKGFPGGPPPQYWPGLSPLNFRVRMGSGVFDEVWPLATIPFPTWATQFFFRFLEIFRRMCVSYLGQPDTPILPNNISHKTNNRGNSYNILYCVARKYVV